MAATRKQAGEKIKSTILNCETEHTDLKENSQLVKTLTEAKHSKRYRNIQKQNGASKQRNSSEIETECNNGNTNGKNFQDGRNENLSKKQTNQKEDKHKTYTQRRVLANARERSRVHKLGKAFEALRQVIPCYTRDQKLSKLSILRIAISYISALASLLNFDQSARARKLFAESVDDCSLALQSEFGRSKGVKKSRNKEIQIPLI